MENLEKDLTKYQECIVELMTVDSTDKSRKCLVTLEEFLKVSGIEKEHLKIDEKIKI